MSLTGKVAIVTGASRGIGKGIALQLGEAGAVVYITGRTVESSEGAPAPGSLNETAQEVEKRGGKCIPVACDHSVDADIDALFEKVSREQNGRLDILVNNAYSAVDVLMKMRGEPFWKVPPTLWDDVNNVGLRNHYICAVKAAEMMTVRNSGLIVNISSAGGLTYLFTPAYGIGKAACDRMAADCAVELKKYNVTFISLWPGAVKTELIQKHVLTPMKEKADLSRDVSGGGGAQFESARDAKAEMLNNMFANGETIEFSGKCIVALAQDANILRKTGRVQTTGELGEEYVLADIDGRRYGNTRSIKSILQLGGWKKTADYVPQFITVPRFLVNAYFGRF